ncbi:EAL domain-containing protein [Desulfovibrio cuneatus]|uniref:EAL domain-containing protein n=1 Tax=Desulfovibrio cuneatus TaxID=159728 RepID=UPI000486CF27|nr:GGDEF domain-containing phosphodiesterase [Desulfovibrio cuneatus]
MIDFDVMRLAFESAQTYYMTMLPLALLQTATMLGMVNVVSILGKDVMLYDRNSWTLGLVLGFSSFLSIGLSRAWLHPDGLITIYLSYDVLFISTIFGGWKSTFAALIFTCLSRTMYGGILPMEVSFFDMALTALAGYALRQLLSRGTLQLARPSDILLLALGRFGAVSVGPTMFAVLGEMSIATWFDVIFRRGFDSLTISLAVMVLVTKFFRREMDRSRQLYIDPLCHLPNRRALLRDLAKPEEEAGSVWRKPHVTLFLIRVENLRSLTLERGYMWADSFLQEVGKHLKQLQHNKEWEKIWLRAYSPAEGAFVVMLDSGMSDEEHSLIMGRRLYNALHLEDFEGQTGLFPRITVGCVSVKLPYKRHAERFLRALSLYERQYGASVYCMEEGFMQTIFEERQIRIRLEQWIAQGTAEVHFQPKVRLTNNACVGAESLMRMRSAKGGGLYINPHRVLSVAVKYHLLEELEWAIIRRVVACLGEMPQVLQHLQVSINITPASLARAKFGERLCALLEGTGIGAHRVILEIIETSQLPDSDVVTSNIQVLHRHGVCLSLDDYGTGYASISLLSRYPFTELKIDYSMTSNMGDARVLSAIQLSAETAKRYGAELVAEGIETEDQKLALCDMGIGKGQGYLFAKAVPFADFVDFALQPQPEAGTLPAMVPDSSTALQVAEATYNLPSVC